MHDLSKNETTAIGHWNGPLKWMQKIAPSPTRHCNEISDMVACPILWVVVMRIATVLVVVPRGGSPPALSHCEATDVDQTGRVIGQLRL